MSTENANTNQNPPIITNSQPNIVQVSTHDLAKSWYRSKLKHPDPKLDEESSESTEVY